VSIIGALLAVNLFGVGFLLLRNSNARGAGAAASTHVAAAATPSTTPSAIAASPPGPAMGALPAAAPPAAASGEAATAVPTPAPAASPALGTAPSAPPSNPASATAPTGDSGVARAGDTDAGGASADDLAPAVEPRRAPSSPGVIRGTASGLPSYQDAAAAPGANFPDLRLDLLTYSARPDERFVFINMTKLREGEASRQGVRVETINPDGVVLSYRGTRFLLQPQ
jgi:general secretion pathway protein B